MNRRAWRNAQPLWLFAPALFLLAGCGGVPNGSTVKNDLSAMATGRVTIADANAYTVWLARSPKEQKIGLMNVTEAELPLDRGMLFIFRRNDYLSFWMRNTIIPLDIAYIRDDGTIVRTYTMAALDESGYPSIQPARFALELRAGQLAEKGIKEGDHVDIPPSLLIPASQPSE